MTRTTSRVALASLALALAVVPLQAATITIVNTLDPPGFGFNDTTVVAPVGGNPGTTLGQQRLNVFQQAANIWGAQLPSNVEIKVYSFWDSTMTCTATTATLGSAGAIEIYSDFPGAEFTGTWYPVALANKLSNTDQNPAENDLQARFNPDLGTPGCLDTSPWYLGYDGNEGAGVDLFAVILHEMGHGLGFATYVNKSTGVWCCPAPDPQQPDIYSRYILDEVTGLVWSDPTETNAQRQASAISLTNLTWNGTNVTTNVPTYLARQPRLIVTAPAPAVGSYPVGTAAFGAPLTDPGFVGQTIVAATDTGGVSADDGCEAITNGATVAGNIAMVNRGNCTFVIKVKNCQDAGAIAVVIVNNAAGAFGLGGSDPTITIPSVGIDQTQGNLIRANLPATADLGLNTMPRAGTNAAGRVMLYAPNPVQGGSSVSHWDTTAFPNLLMEPAINSDLNHTVDLTLEQMRDIGWFLPPVPVELMQLEIE